MKHAFLSGFVVLTVLLAGCQYKPSRTVTDIYDPPRFSETVELPQDSKPAMVYFAKGRLYVSYFDRMTVDILTPDGKKTGQFQAALRPDSGMPQGMAMSGERLVIADYDNRALVFFNQSGEYVESFARLPNGDEFMPVGAAVYNRVFYITDKKAHGWLAIGDDGELISVVKSAYEQNSLKFPYGIAVTEDGRVIVTDPEGGKIKVFACRGWYAYDLPTAELGLQNPSGLAIDGLGRIHVVDNGTNRIFVYDNKGRFVFKYGKGLEGPSNIAVDKERRKIYITNTEKGSLSVWEY